MTAEIPQSTELAVLRGELMTALSDLRGDVRLVLQAQQQSALRADQHATELRRLDERMDGVERDMVPRAELTLALADLRAETETKAREARAETETKFREAREEQKHRERQRLAAIAIVVTVVAAVVSVIVTLVTTP